MTIWSVINSLTFRYIAKYVVVLSASVFLLLAALYAYISYGFFTELSESILDEQETLAVIYAGQSIAGVEQYVNDQLTAPASGRFYYLVTDGSGQRVAGDLNEVPRYEQFRGGWLGFQLALLEWGETVDVDFLARPMDLGGDYTAIVARNYADVTAQASLVIRTLFRAMIATIVLGMVGGFLSATSTLSRVERLNRELSGIIEGGPEQRINVDAQKGYVRELAEIMNSLLAQSEGLLRGVKTVSDNIAHDLRTPLTRMRNQLEQLRASEQGDTALALNDIISECDDILGTFNALLRISSLETGGLYSGSAEVPLDQLLADVVELYEPLAAERDIALTLQMDACPAVAGDRDLLFQLFLNLVDNAIKYTPNGGSVVVRAAALVGFGARIVVGDSGPGIPADQHGNVLRRFFRIESSRGTHPGHGLGLSLVQAIVTFHRGVLSLGDNAPGLRVTVDLPQLSSRRK